MSVFLAGKKIMLNLLFSKRRLKFLRKETKETKKLVELQQTLNELYKEEDEIVKKKK